LRGELVSTPGNPQVCYDFKRSSQLRRALTRLKHGCPLGARGKTGFNGLGKKCRPRGFRRFRRERPPVRQSGTGCAGYAVTTSIAGADVFWLPVLFRSHARPRQRSRFCPDE
jgi:hypothetical protein